MPLKKGGPGSQDATKKSMYVSRSLRNAADVIAWAKREGFKQTLAPGDMHVTVAFSREPMDWAAAGDSSDSLIVGNGLISVEPLGDKGGIVMLFNSPDLTKRWQEFRDAGASWDFPEYKPHITLTYSGDGAPDLSGVRPYEGELEFGPEKFAEVDDNWTDKIKERPAMDGLAFDKKSVRTFDKDGRMRVEMANISKANICEYHGSEIPDCEGLGLDPDKTYRLLRDPKELEASAPTFNGVQLLVKHIPVKAGDHQPDSIVGTTGTETVFNDPYLQTPLVVWAQEGIDLIESEEQKELSSAYHYRADMTPGSFKGEPYDGVMRDIVGNHVALVKEGRAGSDVVVGDEALSKSPPKLKEFDMTKKVTPAPLSRKAAVLKGALLISVPPLLAQDAKAKLDTGMFDGALKGITSKNFAAKKDAVITAIKALVTPHLAQDADIEDLVKVVEAFKDGEEVEGKDAETAPNSAIPLKAKEKAEGEDEEEPYAKMRERLKGKLSAEDMAACDAEMGYEPPAEANDAETEEEKKARAEKEASDKKAKDAEKPVTKAAMDAAMTKIATDVRAKVVSEQKALREAENMVRPYVGDIVMAHDSAEAVLRTTLATVRPELIAQDENALDKFDLPALKALLSVIPVPNKARDANPDIAMDSKALNSFETMFPDTKRFRA